MSKPTNSKDGARVERIAIMILERDGYTVDRTVRTPFKSKHGWASHRSDFFGCIDIIAKRHDDRTRWIQVTKGRAISQKKEKLEHVPWNLEVDSVEIWRWVKAGKRIKRPHFRVYWMDAGFSLAATTRLFLPSKGTPCKAGLGESPS